MGTEAGRDNSPPGPDYRRRRLLALLLLLAAVLFALYAPAREFIKTTVLLGMPALVVWSYRRRFIKYTWTWWVSSLILLALIAGYGLMLMGLPQKLAVKGIERQAGIYLTQGQYDRAISKYREMEPYGLPGRMERKIREAEKQQGYARSYEEARILARDGRYPEARGLLEDIPLEAVVYPQARQLLRELEKD